MNDLLRWCLVGLLAFGGALLPVAALAQDGDPAVIIQKFGGKQSFDDTEAVIAELAATGEPEVARTLRALSAGDLYWRESDEAVFIVTGKGNAVTLRDPLTGKEAGTAPSGDLTKVRIKNSIRNAITGALGSLTLRAADPNVRLRAASTLFSDADPDMLEPIEAALAEETDPAVKARMEEARASAILSSDRPAAAKAEAAAILEARGDRESLTMLTRFAAARKSVV